MRDRVERDAAFAARRVVAQSARHERVAELVERDRNEQHEHADQDPPDLFACDVHA